MEFSFLIYLDAKFVSVNRIDLIEHQVKKEKKTVKNQM